MSERDGEFLESLLAPEFVQSYRRPDGDMAAPDPLDKSTYMEMMTAGFKAERLHEMSFEFTDLGAAQEVGSGRWIISGTAYTWKITSVARVGKNGKSTDELKTHVVRKSNVEIEVRSSGGAFLITRWVEGIE